MKIFSACNRFLNQTSKLLLSGLFGDGQQSGRKVVLLTSFCQESLVKLGIKAKLAYAAAIGSLPFRERRSSVGAAVGARAKSLWAFLQMKVSDDIKPVIWVALFLDAASLAVALPIVPKLIQVLVHGNVARAASWYGLLLAMSGVLLFFVGPVQASLADYFGRKKMLMAATCGSAISFLALAWAPNLLFLFLAQVVYAASGASQPVANCYITELSRPDDRAKNFATMSGICTLGFVVGAALGGLLGQLSLHLAMTMAALTSMAAAIMMFYCFVESADLSKKNRLSLNLLSSNPIVGSKFLFSRPQLAEFAFIMICGDFAFQAFLSTWVLFTTLRFHWTIGQTGASLALEGLFGVAVQLGLLRYILPHLGLRGTILAALAFDTLALLLYNSIDGGLIVISVIALHCMGAAVRPVCTAALSQAAAPGEQSLLQGAIASQYALSSTVATLLGTALFSYFTSAAAPISIPGISMIVGFVVLVAAMFVAALPYGSGLLSFLRRTVGTDTLLPVKARTKAGL